MCLEMWLFMQIFLILCVVFFDHVGLGIVYPMFSSMLFQQDTLFVDASMSMVARGGVLGALLSVPAIACFFSGPILGTMSDQIGRRPVYLSSLALAVLGYLCCIAAVHMHSIMGLIFARGIVGIAVGNAAVVSATIVDLSNDHTKAKNFGLYCMASGAGFAVGPFLGGWLSSGGFVIPFVATGIAMFGNLILIFLLFKETNPSKKGGVIVLADGINNVKKAFRIRELRGLFVVVILFCFGWSLVYEFLPVLWITEYGFSLKKVGYFFGFGSAVFAISSGILIRPIINRFDPRTIFLCALCALGISILFLLAKLSVCFIWVLLFLINFFTALSFPTYTTLVSNSTKKDSQGEILGILESIQATAFGVSPLVAGFLIGIDMKMPMIVGSAAMLIAAVLLRTGKNVRSILEPGEV